MATGVVRSTKLAYRVKGKRTAVQLRADVQKAWSEAVGRNSTAKAELGLDPAKPLPAALKKSPYAVSRRQAAGGDPTLLIDLGVAAIHLGAKVLWSVWQKWVVPRLKRSVPLDPVKAVRARITKKPTQKKVAKKTVAKKKSAKRG